MSDDIQKETERIHQGIVESLSFSEALAKRDAEIERLREENDALKIRIGTYYAGNANGGIVKQLESEIEQLRKERDSAFETWKAMHVATLNGFIKQHHEPLKTEIEQLRDEIAEHDGILSVWRRRCTDADTEIERLHATCEKMKLAIEVEIELRINARDEIERLRKKLARVAALDDDIGVYPKAIKGFNDERDYEQRDGFKNGWNAAAMELMKRLSEALRDADGVPK